jgi:hypothetical protein
MASILAYIEVREGAITPQSRFVMAEARRVADGAGATVYGLLAVGPKSHVEIDALAEVVSSAGADRVLCSSDPGLAGPALDATHGALLAHVAEHLRPVLILFPAGGSAVQLGPPLAVRIGAAYMPAAGIDIVPEPRAPDLPSPRVIVRRWRAARDGLRKIDVGDLERPVVVSLIAGESATAASVSYAEVEIMPCPEPRHPTVSLREAIPDVSARVEESSRLLWVTDDLDAPVRARLQAALPATTGVVVGGELDASDLLAATPGHLVIVGASSLSPIDTPIVGPGRQAVQVGDRAGLSSSAAHVDAEVESLLAWVDAQNGTSTGGGA